MTRSWLVFLAAALVGCGGSSSNSSGGLTVSVADAATRPPRTLSPIDPRRRTVITDAVAKVSPAVVTVQTEIVQHTTDPFETFFGRGGDRVLPGLGSGFIVRADGVIVTNAHVIADANTISVALRDGTTYPAKLLGKDEINDIAVLKIPAKGLPVATLGNSDNLLIGEWAIAIGNPYGFLLGNSEPSVTTGVISGTGRNLAARAEGNATYVDMIQTDAAINPGNSGGPLVNAVGEVIGMNSSIYTPSGGSVGLGFAIPIDRVKRVTDDLLLHGTIRRPWIGVKLELPETQNPREALHSGVVIHSVLPGSPAAQAGLRAGDVLVRSGDRTLRNPFDWEAELLDLRVGEEVPLIVRRGGREFPVNVKVADLPEVSAPKVQVLKELEVVTLTPAIRAERGIRSQHGALIYNVSKRVADDIGIETGDVIVQINRASIDDAQDVAKALDAFADRGMIRMFFERGGRIYFTDFMIR
ncbi:MAG TPA: trypsin-like peptidase domain-containing protein [Gemmatimonadaceae bacterium]|nr:trypsin-like peptidase domain-containing protein [Gemmatimonadaceae bacterium]